MQFIKNQGILATKSELTALLACTTTSLPTLDGIGIRVADGKLLAQASNGAAAVYHHGPAYDGAGGSYDGEHQWQLSRSIVSSVAKLMGPAHEAHFVIDKKGKMPRCRIMVVGEDGSTQVNDLSLDGHVAEQLGLPSMIDTVPCEVPEFSSPLECFVADPRLLALLTRAAKACGARECKLTMPDADGKPIYGEACGLPDDSGAAPRWVVAIMPVGEEE